MIEIRKINKAFGKENILNNVCLTINQGEVISLVGSSGSGKTTLLKIIAGIEKQDSGEIFLNQNEISNWSPQKRHCIYLYQEALLFPHLNVFENIAFGLRLQKMNSSIIDQKVNQMLEFLGIENHAKKMSNQLSGGQKQRVSFGRAMVIEPKLLLLDEPFGALDAQTRNNMQELFKSLVKKTNTTALFVTHDIKEAIKIGDSVGKISKGNLFQFNSIEQFINDSESGVLEEINFWKKYQN
ncbi:MAG: ABC-type Fe3+/spermidine/putrescine transport system ATPase subunit [Flavobacterium sp.]|jgi:ABC-type Fe3+/spermidine/putrescine transport system ATPase subunit